MLHDLRHIRAFLTLARAGSFTRAAAELNMAQPTLTVQIQHLETALGVKLFDRTKRHVASRPPAAIFACPSSGFSWMWKPSPRTRRNCSSIAAAW
jgi:hypothetical protein